MEKLLLLLCFFSSAHAWWIFSGGSGRQIASGEINEDCIRKAERGDCTFYICFDQRHMCESHNYALSYGWRYCDQMNKNFERFTPEAQEWVRNTRKCSMTKMLEFYRASHINCHDVEQEMQDNHAACEAEHGVCDHNLLSDNKDVLMDIYKFNRKAMVRFFNMIQECGLDTASDVLSWMNEQRKTVLAFFKTLKNRFEGMDEDLAGIRDSIKERWDNLDEDIENIRESLPDISELPGVPNLN